jgi:curved DNA-binding protein CbpA
MNANTVLASGESALLRSRGGATFYDVLGVPRTASDKVIRAAFRKAAKALHPDVNGEDTQAEKHLRHVIAAYQLLRSPQQRAIYNQLLATNERTLRNWGHLRIRQAVAATTVAALVTACIVTIAVWLTSEPPSTRYVAEDNVTNSTLQTQAAVDTISDESRAETKLPSQNGTDDTIGKGPARRFCSPERRADHQGGFGSRQHLFH